MRTEVLAVDKKICALRDSLSAFGLLRASTPFTVSLYLQDDAATAPLLSREVLPFPAGFTFDFEPLQDSREPVVIHPDAASLLAQAEEERRRKLNLVRYIQIFEAAFGQTKEGPLINSLERFLKGSVCAAPKKEVRQWLNMRGEDAHAGRNRRSFEDIEYDLAVKRIRQSAIDVAYNKRDWGEKNTARAQRINLVSWYKSDGNVSGLRGVCITKVVRREAFAGAFLHTFKSEEEHRSALVGSHDIIVGRVLDRDPKWKQLVAFGSEGQMTVSSVDFDAEPMFPRITWHLEQA